MHPLITVLIFSGAGLLRWKLHNRELQERIHKCTILNRPAAWLFQPYTFFLSCFVVIYFYLCIRCTILFAKTAWLSPLPENLPDSGAEWWQRRKHEFDLPHWTRILALMAPLWIGLTFVMTIFHLGKHLPADRGYDSHLRWYPSFSHDLAIQVVVLPLVYGVYALDALRAMLALVTGEALDAEVVHHQNETDWNHTVSLASQTYEADFETADLYEAWALQCFAGICYTMIDRQIWKEVPTVKNLMERIRRNLLESGGSDDRDYRLLQEVTLLDDPERLLFKPLKQICGFGVSVFVYTYAFKSLYLLTLQALATPPLDMELCGSRGLFPAVCSLEQYVDGASFLASSMAIIFLVYFEQALKDVLDRDRAQGSGKFRAFKKFVTVKVMVSIAFFQQYGLDLLLGEFANYSEIQIQLCYACLICWEVFPLSLLVYYAWRPHVNDWHDDDSYCWPEAASGNLQGGQLAGETGSFCWHNKHWQESRETNVFSRGPDLNEVTGVLEIRGQMSWDQGKALEGFVNSFAHRTTATYKPAAIFQMRQRAAGAREVAKDVPLFGGGALQSSGLPTPSSSSEKATPSSVSRISPTLGVGLSGPSTLQVSPTLGVGLSAPSALQQPLQGSSRSTPRPAGLS
eukprot:TRINITY_DN41700_c0_g2_i1.p1 TRINITY_DN41700_c0_g2~~TRINITY_DN41700_c0_g2_i1.p1  ORF type:complete len:629 (-),score=137.32 TRINITY_DN41700_c0_g2_i1:234-2120(-)